MAIVLSMACLGGFTAPVIADTVVAWGYNGNGQTNVPGGLSGVTAIAGGSEYSLALKSDGTVVAWGYNGYGQTTAPGGLSGVTAIAAGGRHSLALKSDRTVVAWGYNAQGQTNVPGGLSGVTAIAAGYAHSLALKSDGTVVAWGWNGYGLTNVPGGLSGVTAIAGGDNHSLALQEAASPTDILLSSTSVLENQPAGTVVGILSAVDPNLGDIHTFSFVSGTGDADNASFTIDGTSLKTAAVFDYETKNSYSIRILATDFGGLTFEKTFTISSDVNEAPTDILLSSTSVLENQPAGMMVGILSAVDPNLSDIHTFSFVSGTGDADNGSFTIDGTSLKTAAVFDYETKNSYSIRVRVSDSGALTFETQFTITVTPLIAGTVVAWGYNDKGQTTVPGGLTGVTAIAGGFLHSLALKSNWTVVAWGWNGNGQTTVPGGLSGVTAIAAGYVHSLALKSDGTVVAWGWNGYGQTTVPGGLSGVTAIAAGYEHNLALKSDGTVVAWGYNEYGQTTVPGGLSGVTAIAAGYAHSLALKSDGTVVAWGWNGNGQTTVPGGLSGVTAIAAGGRHIVALKSDGTVVAWGYNEYGQTTVPGGLSGVTAIAAGVEHSLALKSDGTVVAWGRNTDGQTTVPGSLSGVTAISGGGSHSLALQEAASPTDILLSSASVLENQSVATVVGILSAVDPNLGDTHSFTLVSGTGDADNGSFTIDGTSFKTAAVFDFETKSSYSIRLRATDSGGLTFEKIFVISIGDVEEGPFPMEIVNENGTFRLSFESVEGWTYVIQYKNALSDATWLELDSVTGNGEPMSVTPDINGISRFYRLHIVPN